MLAAGQPWLPQGLQVRVLTSGRDLLPRQGEQRSPGQALVLANPSFVGWEPLPGTEAEGLQVAADLGVALRQGPQASVKALEAARGPKVLHVASHGFFEENTPSGDPLLASGVVLAGADRNSLPSQRPAAESASRTTSSEDDGYLTAKEAAQLQLDGTELVVLSACDTASGTIETGEGVYGLQRALTAAGARSTLLSLWKVDDEATAYFMRRYYKLLKAGKGRREALVAVQEEFRTDPPVPAWSDIKVWAAWQLTGDGGPVPLDR